MTDRGDDLPTHLLECRLRRIEGQVCGVLHMLEDGRGTDDILIQLASIRGAVHGLERQLVDVELTRLFDGVLSGRLPATDEALRDLRVSVGHLWRS